MEIPEGRADMVCPQRQSGRASQLGGSLSRREDKIDRHLTLALGFGVSTIIARWNSPNNQVPVQKFRNVVSTLSVDSMNKSELPETAP